MKSTKNEIKVTEIKTALIALAVLTVFAVITINAKAFAANSSSINNDKNDVTLLNIHTVPSTIHVGDTFTINATVMNHSPNNITITLINCNGPLSASFDKNVNVTQAGFCNKLVFFPIDIKPGESASTSTTANSLLQYKASSAGITHSNLQLIYTKNGGPFFITQPFVFQIR
jgi:hypothetical protein